MTHAEKCSQLDSSCRSLSVLAFGIPFSEDRVTAQHGTESVRLFSPGALFCIVWWRQSKKRQHRTLTILEAPGTRGEGDLVLDVHPAAIVHVFMDQYGPAGQERSIDQMLDLIQSVRNRGIEPAGVTARYWRRASRRILLGQEPPELAAGDFPNQLVDYVQILDTYGDQSYTSVYGSNYIEISDTLSGISATSNYTLEFIQNQQESGTSGVRALEFEASNTPTSVPEPTVISVLAFGGIPLCTRRKRT